MRELKGKKVAVLGYGLEGKDLVSYLLGESAVVTIFDKKEEKELDLAREVKKKTRLSLGENYLSGGLKDFDIVFRSPGFYRYVPEIVEAEKVGVEISSAIKLFFDLCTGKVIGVTGTKGKGTTSTLIFNIFKAAGKDAYLAGNIGKPYLELLRKLKETSWVVLELSSFQLIDLTKSPHIAVVLNVTLDHLDWHKDRKEYIEAKKNIVKNQNRDNFAVVNYDFASSKDFSKYAKGEVYYFSKLKRVRGSYVQEGKILLSTDRKDWRIGETSDLLLRGRHNWENVTAAICAARLAGASLEAIRKTVFSFKGLEHRLELVGKVGGVTFYNDSFSTNPQPTIAAIDSFKEPITLILGGSDKSLEYGELAEKIKKRKNVETVILIGEIVAKIKRPLVKVGYGGKLIDLGRGPMRKIVRTASKNTPKGGVVLLSPATASFDMFKDYKERGKQFKKVIRRL